MKTSFSQIEFITYFTEFVCSNFLCVLLGYFSLMCSVKQVVSNSLLLHELQLTRLLCPWNFPGENMGVGCHFLLQGIFLTQGSNTCFLPASPALAGRFFTTGKTVVATPGKPCVIQMYTYVILRPSNMMSNTMDFRILNLLGLVMMNILTCCWILFTNYLIFFIDIQK